MKKKNLLISLAIVFGLLFGASFSNSQTLTFGDDASNYETSTWIDGSNNGSGFGPWMMWNDGANSGFFVWSSTENGHGNINTEDLAFGMYGHGGQYANAQRAITEWGVGATFSVQLAVQWRDGQRGISLFNTNGFAPGDEIWNFNINDDGYGSTGWVYYSDIVITVEVTQDSDELVIQVTGTSVSESWSDTWSTTVPDQTLGGFRIYRGDGTGPEGQRNLYFNNLVITRNLVSATINPNEILVYTNWDNVNPEIEITWNDASEVTGMSYFNPEFSEWIPLPEEMWEVVNDNGTTATLVIDLDQSPAKLSSNREGDQLVEQIPWRVEFNVGEPAIGQTNLTVKTFNISFDVKDVNENPIPANTMIWPNWDSENPGEIWGYSSPNYIVSAQGYYSYSVSADGFNTVLGNVDNITSDIVVPITLYELADNYTVTYGIVGGNGWINASVDGFWIGSGQQVEEGKNVTFDAWPNWGYTIKEWKVNNQVVEGFTGNSFVYENLQQNINVTVEFKEMIIPQILPEYQPFGLNDGEDVHFQILWGTETELVELTHGYYDEELDEWIEITLVEGEDYVVNDDVLTIFASFIISLNPELDSWIDFNAQFGSGWNVWFGIVVVETTKPTVNPSTLFYDLTNPGNLMTTIMFNSAQDLISITESGVELEEGVDYHVQGAWLFIHDEYLSEVLQEVNYEIILTILFDTDDEVELTITTIESGIGNATISPTSIEFPENEFPEYTDVTITWNDATEVESLFVFVVSSWGSEEFEWPFYEVTDNGDGTANLRIFFDEVDKMKSLNTKDTKGIEYTYVTVKINFDIGAPANFLMTIWYEYYEVNVTVLPFFGGWVEGDWEYDPGDEVTLTAYPSMGYEFVQWEDMEGEVVSTDNPYIFIMPQSDVNLVARFVRVYHVEFSVQGNDWGTLTATIDGEPIESDSYQTAGSSIVFTATPNPGYMVAGWYYNWNPIEGYIDLQYVVENLSEDISVNVFFMQIPEGSHLVTYGVLGGYGSLTATVDGFELPSGSAVLEGSDITFIATPADGYRVKEWTVNGTPIDDFVEEVYVVENLTENTHVTVEFEWIPVFHTVTFSVVEVAGATNGTLTATVDGAAIDSGDEVLQGKNVVFTAAPNTGFVVKEWKLNDALVEGYTELTYTVTNLMGDVDVKVEFDLEVSVIAPSLAQLKAYPNPFNSLIRISNANLVNRVVVTNLIGQQVMSITLNGFDSFDTSHLSKGIYLISFEGFNGERVVRRMVKQ